MVKSQMGILIDGAIFNYDDSDLDLSHLLKKLESVGLELGASTQPIDSEGNLYRYTEDWEVGNFDKDYFE